MRKPKTRSVQQGQRRKSNDSRTHRAINTIERVYVFAAACTGAFGSVVFRHTIRNV